MPAQSLLSLHLCCRRSNAQLDAVAWYLHSMGSTHVLSRSEEVQLGAIIFLGKAITAAQVTFCRQKCFHNVCTPGL